MANVASDKSFDAQLSRLRELEKSIHDTEQRLRQDSEELAKVRSQEGTCRNLVRDQDLFGRSLESLRHLQTELERDLENFTNPNRLAALKSERASLLQRKQTLTQRAATLDELHDYINRYRDLAERWAALHKSVNDLGELAQMATELEQLEKKHAELLMAWRRHSILQETLREIEGQHRRTPDIVRDLANKLGEPGRANGWLQMLSQKERQTEFAAEVRSLIIDRAMELPSAHEKLDLLRRAVSRQEDEVSSLANEVWALEKELQDAEALERNLPDFDDWFRQVRTISQDLRVDIETSPEGGWDNLNVYEQIRGKLEPCVAVLQRYAEQVESEVDEARQRQIVR